MARKPDTDPPRFVLDALAPQSSETVHYWADAAEQLMSAGQIPAGRTAQVRKDIEEARKLAEKMDVYRRVYESLPADLPHNVRCAAAGAAAERLHTQG